jgi:hypothetical protein
MAALARLQAILACLCTDSAAVDHLRLADEKSNNDFTTDPRTPESVPEKVVSTLINAEKPGRNLEARLDAIVGTQGWTEKIAEWTLQRMEQVLKAGKSLGPAVKEAMDKAMAVLETVEGFVKEHPVMCTVIALGVLVILAPWAVEALGFGELGPIEGTFAAAWQSRYAGYVPKGSLFSFLQRCGMVWHLNVVA